MRPNEPIERSPPRCAVTREAACYHLAVIDKHVSTVLEITGIVIQTRKLRGGET